MVPRRAVEAVLAQLEAQIRTLMNSADRPLVARAAPARRATFRRLARDIAALRRRIKVLWRRHRSPADHSLRHRRTPTP
ncbi:MAG: hypothetical protein ACK4L4_18255 [Gemmobacter sp.]